MNRYFNGAEYQKGFGLGGVGRTQRGGFGLGGFFSKFINILTPYFNKAKDYALPILKSGAQQVGKEVVKTAADIAKDVLEGKNIKNSAKERITTSVDSLAKQANEKLTGLGYKRKSKKRKNKVIPKKNKKKKRNFDIFDF